MKRENVTFLLGGIFLGFILGTVFALFLLRAPAPAALQAALPAPANAAGPVGDGDAPAGSGAGEGGGVPATAACDRAAGGIASVMLSRYFCGGWCCS